MHTAMKCLSFMERFFFPLLLRLHGLKQHLSVLVRAQVFYPSCLPAGKGERPECCGMTVSGTHPAFPSAPAVRAKAEKGEMADIYTLTHKAVKYQREATSAWVGIPSEGRDVDSVLR